MSENERLEEKELCLIICSNPEPCKSACPTLVSAKKIKSLAFAAGVESGKQTQKAEDEREIERIKIQSNNMMKLNISEAEKHGARELATYAKQKCDNPEHTASIYKLMRIQCPLCWQSKLKEIETP